MARDNQQVRRNIAENAMIHSTRVLDDLRALRALRTQKIALGAFGDFTDDDFGPPFGLAHLTPAIVTGLLDEANEMLTELEADNGMNYFLESRQG